MLLEEIPLEDEQLHHPMRAYDWTGVEDDCFCAACFHRHFWIGVKNHIGVTAIHFLQATKHSQGTGIHVAMGTRDDFVVKSLEGILGNRIVAIKKNDIFALRHVDARVPRGGTGAAAWAGENLEAGILCGVFANNSFGVVLGSLYADKTFPLTERLGQYGVQAFSDKWFHIAAGDYDGDKWFHLTRG